MISFNRNSALIFIICLCTLFIFYHIPFSIYGQDGYSLWFPIVSEYLKGDHIYQKSPVIFNGQNLASIYGYLPFWKILRYFNFEIHTFLNITHAVFIILLFNTLIEIFKGIRKEILTYEILIIFIYTLLSPIVTNRIMAGHLNLLFGILPFFSLLSLIFNKSFKNIAISFLVFWFALSTQAFQILTYHLFYVPFLFYFFNKEEKRKGAYIIIALSSLILVFFLNLNNFLLMYSHATGEDNLRNIHANVVYSYITSHIYDLIQFQVSGFYYQLQRLPKGFFHEINYPLGGFIFLFIGLNKDKLFKIIYFIFLILLFAFCLDTFPFNIISNLPLIKSFRVPQRSFMVPLLFLPVWIFAVSEVKLKLKDFISFIVLSSMSVFLDYFEFIVILTLVFNLIGLIRISKATAIIISFAGLFCGTFNKINPSYIQNLQFNEASSYLNQIRNKYSVEQLSKNIFHFETNSPHLVNYVAQTQGIRTIEGYGHPPAKITKIYESTTGNRLPQTTNVFYLVGDLPNKNELLKNLGVTKIIHFGKFNEIYEEDLK